MRQISIAILLFFLPILLGYLLVSYAHWDINPKHWGGFDRGFSLLLTVIVGLVACTTYLNNKSYDDEE
jgi:amino acid permease